MKKANMLRTMVGMAVVALVLGACEVSVTVRDPDVQVSARASTTANLANETPRTEEQLGPDESLLVRVDVPSNASDGLYLYLDEELDLTVRNSSRSAVASSTGPDFFAAGTLALSQASSPAAQALEPAVVSSQACPGTCVILDNPGSTRVYMDLSNPTGQTVNVGVYAVLRDFDDGNERRSEPVRFSSTEQDALETLEDEDVYEAGSGGTLFFDAVDSPLAFRATIIDPSGFDAPTTISDGESVTVFEDDIIRVEAVNSRAAVSSQSMYFLEID